MNLPGPNARVLHRHHPEYGFGTVRYQEDDPFGEIRLQIAFDHLDHLVNVAPAEVTAVGDPWADVANGDWGEVGAFRRKLAAGLIIGENNLTGGFTKSAVQPLPHQAFLLDKILSAERFGHLLADDVGLGKTIEAGLLIMCLMRRDASQHILIICPAGLALQWQDEMEEHFDLNFQIMGQNFDGKTASSWRSQSLVIAPIDRLKRPQYRDLLQQVERFDLVICDEAHRLTARRNFFEQTVEKSRNYQLLEFLVESRLVRFVEDTDKKPRSPRLLLLSATPHQGDDERFAHLLQLARPDLFDARKPAADQLTNLALLETMTRTPKAQAVDWDGNPLFKGHRTVTLDVQWTVEETEASRLLSEYVRKSIESSTASERKSQLIVQLVMHTFHKIAASSWLALEHALQRRLDALHGKAAKLSDLLGDEDEEEEVQDCPIPSKAFFDDELALLKLLLDRVRSLPKDSKWQEFSALLAALEEAEPGAKLLVFTQYRVTQEMMVRRLKEFGGGALVEVIHGDVDQQDRRAARARFERDSRFMVSTEAGGEGLNLQKACHVMVNYDLPWNPMRLQQRIGRLDRYGQKKVVQVFNLRVPDSWDHRISTRILERLEVIQRTMGLAVSGLVENYREIILGEVVDQLEVGRLFAESLRGQSASDADVDSWIRRAVESAQRWRGLFGPDLGLNGDFSSLRPTLTGDHFQSAFGFACAGEGIVLRETRNSRSQYVSGVFHFELPKAFREPVFRPSRTIHLVFDRKVYAEVRDVDLGVVRGQPIRPILCGFGEPFTDWIFQVAMNARSRESAFALAAPADWTNGPGWVVVFAMRWLGSGRRISTPDSLAVVSVGDDGQVVLLKADEAMGLLSAEAAHGGTAAGPAAGLLVQAKRIAQELLRETVTAKRIGTRVSPAISTLMVARIHPA